MIININDNDRILCPKIKDPRHRLVNEILDEMSKNIKHDEDYQIINEESRKVYEAVAYGRFDSRMYLYKEAVSSYIGNRITYVEVYYFKCYVCDFTLPATSTESRP